MTKFNPKWHHLKVLVTLISECGFVLTNLMAVCRLRAGGISLCNAVFDMMIIGCTKQEAVVQGLNVKDVFF